MHLPGETTPFIGRVADRARLAALFDEGRRLVTVLGPAGMGKTRLALRFLAERAGRGLFVDLTEVTAAEGIEGAVASALGATVSPGQPLGPLLAAQGPLLLVCDNFEQLVAHGPLTVGRWLDAAPALKVLVTSRERLGLGPEVVHVIEPLAPDEALALLLQQTRALRPDFDPDPDTRGHLAELAARVEGIPLALELAASRLGVLSPEALIGRLADRFAVLRGARRDVTGRQATLWGAIDWSWRLLSGEEQAALSRCTVFRGDFDADAAEALGVDLETAQALADKSFLRALPGGRLGLFESIREFAAAHLEREARAEAEVRHEAHYLALGEAAAAGVHGPDGLRCRARLVVAQTQLVAVLERALERRDAMAAVRTLASLHPVLTTRGPFEAHLRWLDMAVGLAAGTAVEARALWLRGQLRRLRGRLAESHEDLRTAAERATAAGDRPLLAEILAEAGIVAHEMGELTLAGTLHDEALAIFRARGDRRGEGRALGSLAILNHEKGDVDAAQLGYERALNCVGAVGDSRSEAIFLSNLGDLHLEQGRLEEAREHYLRSRTALERLGDRRTAGVVTGNLGAVSQEEGRLDLAASQREAAVDAMRAVGDLRMEAVFRGYLGCALHEAGDVAGARAAYREAVEVLDGLSDRHFAALFLAHGAALAAATGERAAALRDLDRASVLGEAGVAALVEIHRGHLEDGQARALAASPRTDDERFALRLLRRALGAVEPVSAAPERVLVVDAGRRRLTPPGGEAADLARRESLWRVLEGLLAEHAAHPGRPMPVEAMLAAGWPGERVLRGAAANRVYVAVATLRSVGLRDVLLSREGGYCLDPRCVVRRVI